MDTDSDDLRILALATDAFIATCREVRDDQLTAPTPCTDWDVTQLVDHVTGGNRFTVSVLGGHDGEAALAAAIASFTDEHRVIPAAIGSSDAQRHEFEQPGTLDRSCRHLIGELTGRQVLRLRLHDLIIHTWDLRRALGADAAIETDLADWAVAELAEPGSLTATHFTTGSTTAPTSTADLLAAFGRG